MLSLLLLGGYNACCPKWFLVQNLFYFSEKVPGAFNEFWPKLKPRKTLTHILRSWDHSHQSQTENKTDVMFSY